LQDVVDGFYAELLRQPVMESMSVDEQKRAGDEDPRYRWAAERTLLAWLRTGLALMGFGFVVARFGLFLRELAAVKEAHDSHPRGLSLYIGVALIILGVTVTLLAAREHAQIIRGINRSEPFVPPAWSLGLILSLVLSFIGIAVALYLVSMVM
jgi:putative membrane protein